MREGERCSSDHLVIKRIKLEAIDQITPSTIQFRELNSSDVQILLGRSQMVHQNMQRRFDFDNHQNLLQDKYQLLT